MMVLMHQLKLSLHREWVDNFAVLDLLSKAETDPTKRRDFFAGTETKRGWKSMDEFVKRVQFLVTDLKQASSR